MAASILILNGPNLNMLGTREPAIYGAQTLGDIERLCQNTADGMGLKIDFRQSNDEGELVTWIQQGRPDFTGIIINAGAYTHTSVAILDALKAVDLPTVEVHLSNIHQREAFRHHSYVAAHAFCMITGAGADGYRYALDKLSKILSESGER